MLEGDLESLELPRKPVLYPEETPINDGGTVNHDESSISSSAINPTESISFIVTS
uniref:Uncharacterized protein MANES_14G017400 n=1 Tax=Rhizophora mucronata TaxID=61149 RepID=A0A2P2P9Y5_RHIMU